MHSSMQPDGSGGEAGSGAQQRQRGSYAAWRRENIVAYGGTLACGGLMRRHRRVACGVKA